MCVCLHTYKFDQDQITRDTKTLRKKKKEGGYNHVRLNLQSMVVNDIGEVGAARNEWGKGFGLDF